MSANWSIKKRLATIVLLITVAFIGILFRLSWVQLVQGEELHMKAVDVRARDEVLEPQRGTIYDRNHIELVGNSPVKSIYANPDVFSVRVKVEEGENKQEKEKAAKEKVSREIAFILGLDEADTIRTLSSKQSFAWLKHKVDYEVSEKLGNILQENRVSGIGFVDGTRRAYPQGTMAAHLLGFVGMDISARGGIEKSYDVELSGVPGRVITETDARGRELPQTRSQYIPPIPGNNLVLTIDRTIQYYVERELDKIEEKYNPGRAVIIVTDPMTGGVLAMGSRPSFDPLKYNQYPQSAYDSNPAVHYNYEPGSTVKMLVAAVALEEGVVREGDRYYCPGYIKIKDRRINCWETSGHGAQTFSEGIKNSCNIVFIQAGLKIGKALLYKYLIAFGFGQRTGVDLPGEEVGLLIAGDKASELDLATMSIGQSIAVTPLQLITAVSSLANGGYIMRPHLVRSVENPETKDVKNTEPQVVRQIISQGTSEQVKRLLQRVVLEGSGKKAGFQGYAVAGKTGTAQVPGQGGYAEGKYVSSFVGFVPADKPMITVLVLVAEPKGGKYYGGDVAAPVFQTVARDTMYYLGAPENPDLPGPEGNQEANKKQDPSINDVMIRVPSVIGFPVEEAVKSLGEVGLKYYLGSGIQGLVIEQVPAGDSYGNKGTVVNLKTAALNSNNHSDDVLVPDLKRLTIRRAGSILDQLELTIRPVGSGVAVTQNPGPGKRVPKGTLVTVEFASQ